MVGSLSCRLLPRLLRRSEPDSSQAYLDRSEAKRRLAGLDVIVVTVSASVAGTLRVSEADITDRQGRLANILWIGDVEITARFIVGGAIASQSIGARAFPTGIARLIEAGRRNACRGFTRAEETFDAGRVPREVTRIANFSWLAANLIDTHQVVATRFRSIGSSTGVTQVADRPAGPIRSCINVTPCAGGTPPLFAWFAHRSRDLARAPSSIWNAIETISTCALTRIVASCVLGERDGADAEFSIVKPVAVETYITGWTVREYSY